MSELPVCSIAAKMLSMKCLDPETESAVRDFLARIRADIKVERAILYGSRARGEHRPDSDADVAMFDMARATLLRTGITEDKLPRTHAGVIEAFRNHTRQSERIDQQLAPQLSRIESLRIMADYTDTDIGLTDATDTVRSADVFVQTLEREYGLDETTLMEEFENLASKRNDGVSEPAIAESRIDTNLDRVYLEELRRQARENWLTLQRQRAGSV